MADASSRKPALLCFSALLFFLILPASIAYCEKSGTYSKKSDPGSVFVIELEGPINPATAEFVLRGLVKAKEQGQHWPLSRWIHPGA